MAPSYHQNARSAVGLYVLTALSLRLNTSYAQSRKVCTRMIFTCWESGFSVWGFASRLPLALYPWTLLGDFCPPDSYFAIPLSPLLNLLNF